MTATKRPTRARGIVALAAGGTLLLAGSSFALWHDQSRAEVGTLTTGQLAVDTTEVTWQDISELDPDSWYDLDGSPIEDIDDFRLSPDDWLLAEQEVDLALDGDNLTAVAEVNLVGLEWPNELVKSHDVFLGLHVYRGDQEIGMVMVGDPDLYTETIRVPLASQTWFDANPDHEDIDEIVPVGADLDGAADLSVRLRVEFHDWISEQDLMNLSADLGQLSTSVTQVR